MNIYLPGKETQKGKRKEKGEGRREKGEGRRGKGGGRRGKGEGRWEEGEERREKGEVRMGTGEGEEKTWLVGSMIAGGGNVGDLTSDRSQCNEGRWNRGDFVEKFSSEILDDDDPEILKKNEEELR